MSRAVPALLALAIGAYAFLPICDLHFDCGCTWPGVGGHAHCDIHRSGPPDCPWCDHTWVGYAAFAVSALSTLAALWRLPARIGWPAATAVGIAAFVLAALAAGLLTSWWFELPVLRGL